MSEVLEKKIIEKAKLQLAPLGRDGSEEDYEDFFAVMADAWQIADQFNLAEDIPFTNFLMFGPQSAGKTTITERILGFPIAVVKTGVGTTRPMVLTTRYADIKEEKVRVKGSGGDFKEIPKQHVMRWVQEQMEATGKNASGGSIISHDRIYIEVEGSTHKNRRFVDLPGFQTNNEAGHGNKDAILDLLRVELQNPNTVVVCVEDASVEFANSNLAIAIREAFPTGFANSNDLARRCVLTFNKSDKWLSGSDVTDSTFLYRISSYVEGCGLVPLIVGASVDPENGALRNTRASGQECFNDIVQEYSKANEREISFYKTFFNRMSLSSDIQSCLQDKFLGFKNFLGTIDAVVVNRDIENANKIVQQLQRICDETSQEKNAFLQKRQVLVGGEGNNLERSARRCLDQLLSNLTQILAPDFGGAAAKASDDPAEIRRYGNTALMEEMEFTFGCRHRGQVSSGDFSGFYRPDRMYNSAEFDYSTPGLVKHWKKEILHTIEKLESPAKESNLASISYLYTPLINGKMYERALGVWSSSVYRFLVPSDDDLLRLANVVGTNPEMADPSGFDFLQTKRLAEIYIHRLVPAIQHLCQKIEFLMLKNFETAWRVLMRNNNHKTFAQAVGEDKLKADARKHFQEEIRKRAAIAYDKSFSDLENEVFKLLPYSTDSASVTGMLHAFPAAAKGIRESKVEYTKNVVEKILTKCDEYLKELFPNNEISQALQAGIEFGIRLIAISGSLDPLIFAGLHIVKTVLATISSRLKKRRSAKKGEKEDLAEHRDERLVGIAIILYAHFLPRFIMTIDGRMRSELLSSVKDPSFTEEIKDLVLKSDTLSKRATGKVEYYTREAKRLGKKESMLKDVHEKLVEITLNYPSTNFAEVDGFQTDDEDEEVIDDVYVRNDEEIQFESENFYPQVEKKYTREDIVTVNTEKSDSYDSNSNYDDDDIHSENVSNGSPQTKVKKKRLVGRGFRVRKQGSELSGQDP